MRHATIDGTHADFSGGAPCRYRPRASADAVGAHSIVVEKDGQGSSTDIQRARCIVPASGYYEWRTMEGGKQPYFISAANGAVLSIAGLWDQWKEPESVETISGSVANS